MPSYRVWYRNNPAPLAFVTAYRCTEWQILEHVLAQEKITAPTPSTAPDGTPAAAGPSVKDLIASHALAPVRYTEDESETNTIG